MSSFLPSSDSIDLFVDRARHNLLALETNLQSIGYEFANLFGAVQLADSSAIDAVRSLELRFGELPVLFRRWYETFRCVDFSQASSQLYGTAGDQAAGLGLNCPLIFLGIESCIQLADELIASGNHRWHTEGRIFLPIGGAASNCDPRGIWIPDTSVDPILYDDGAGPVCMSEEVRTALEVGGFPFWDRMFSRRRFTSPVGVSPAYKTIQPALVQNLQPM